MSMLKTLRRLGAALKYAQDPRLTRPMQDGLPPFSRMDIGWPDMPSRRHFPSKPWHGL
jgi:hypothetical protein